MSNTRKERPATPPTTLPAMVPVDGTLSLALLTLPTATPDVVELGGAFVEVRAAALPVIIELVVLPSVIAVMELLVVVVGKPVVPEVVCEAYVEEEENVANVVY